MTKSIGMLVAGEITPTQARLALCGLDMGRPVIVVEEAGKAEGFAGLGSMVRAFLARHRPPQVRGAAFVVSGPVRDGVSLAANLPWPVEAQAIGADLGIEKVTVLNDVEAIAHSLHSVPWDDLLVVSGGAVDEPGNQAVLSAGACPGMAGLYWNGTEHCPFVSQGGHAEFSPSSEAEAILARALATQVPRVTVELLLSSAGLELIYRHLKARGPKEARPTFGEAMAREGAAAVIVREGTTGKDRTCHEAVDAFLSIYGSAAGNLALTLWATGGVYLAGGLAAALGEALSGGAFQEAFRRKAPMQDLLAKIPVHAVLNDRAAILGAAAVAARELRSRRVGGWAS